MGCRAPNQRLGPSWRFRGFLPSFSQLSVLRLTASQAPGRRRRGHAVSWSDSSAGMVGYLDRPLGIACEPRLCRPLASLILQVGQLLVPELPPAHGAQALVRAGSWALSLTRAVVGSPVKTAAKALGVPSPLPVRLAVAPSPLPVSYRCPGRSGTPSRPVEADALWKARKTLRKQRSAFPAPPTGLGKLLPLRWRCAPPPTPDLSASPHRPDDEQAPEKRARSQRKPGALTALPRRYAARWRASLSSRRSFSCQSPSACLRSGQ
jgi:hypothetical protein